MTYTIDKTYAFGANQGSSQRALNLYIILHETDNPRANGANEAANMKNNYTPNTAYATFVVGDGKAYQVGEPGYVAYAAGNANPYSPVQIELQHTTDKTLFAKNYAVYIELARDMAKKYGIPLTLDAGGAGTKGIKSHQWISNNIWGDHTDPYSYLASMGVSKSKLASDLANGTTAVTGGDSTVTKPPVSSGWAVQGKWYPESATFIVGKDVSPGVNINYLPLTVDYTGNGATIANIQVGQAVKYDAVCHANGYVWIRQKRDNGYGYMATGKSVNGKRQDYWGKFK